MTKPTLKDVVEQYRHRLMQVGGEAAADNPATTVINPIGRVLSELNIAFLASGDFPSAQEA